MITRNKDFIKYAKDMIDLNNKKNVYLSKLIKLYEKDEPQNNTTKN